MCTKYPYLSSHVVNSPFAPLEADLKWEMRKERDEKVSSKNFFNKCASLFLNLPRYHRLSPNIYIGTYFHLPRGPTRLQLLHHSAPAESAAPFVGDY
jgi:hypothetical protein